MKNLRGLIILFAILLALSCILIGCGGNTDTDTGKDTDTSSDITNDTSSDKPSDT